MHYDFVERNQTLNAMFYVQQMQQLNKAIQQKRKILVKWHENQEQL